MSKLPVKGIFQKLNKSNQLRCMANGSKKKKLFRHFDPLVQVPGNRVEDRLLQQILLSSLYSLDSQFVLISCIIVLKEFASIFNKETGKRYFLTFPGNGCKKEKNASSIIRILQIRTTTEKIKLTGLGLTRTQSQLCTTTPISSFVQCQVSFRLLPSSVTTFILIKIFLR